MSDHDMKRTRPCLGCDGTGQTCGLCYEGVDREIGPTGYAFHVWSGEDPEPCFGLDCPACLGTGTQQDRRTAAQAMVDAETLLEIGAGMFLSGDDLSILSAEGFGESAARAMRGEIPDAPCPCGCGKSAMRWHFAERAAHAAFRAVPALRDGLEG